MITARGNSTSSRPVSLFLGDERARSQSASQSTLPQLFLTEEAQISTKVEFGVNAGEIEVRYNHIWYT